MKDRKNLVMIIIIGITICLFLCFNTTVFATTGVVTTSDLRLRKEASTSSDVLAVLQENAEVEIISESDDWYKVEYNNQVGYVSKDYIEVKESTNILNTANTQTNSTENGTTNQSSEKNNTTNDVTTTSTTEESVTTSKVTTKKATVASQSDIRILPLINSDTISTTSSEEEYEVTSTVGSWAYIKNDSKEGWVLSESLSIEETQIEEETATKETSEDSDETEETTEDEVAESEETENSDDEDQAEETETDEEETTTSKTYYVNGTTVNARSEASTSSSIVTQLDTNDEVEVTGEDGEWYIVNINGKTAYILKTLLSSKKVDTTSRSSSSIEETAETATETSTTETTTVATTSSSGVTGDDVVAYAKQFLGYPYVYGNNGPNSFDCSGFVQYVYKHFGYSLSHSSKAQANQGVAVSKSDLQPGDVLIFLNTAKTQVGHVGIYIGNGQFIHASTSKTGVIISSLSSSSYQQRYVGARRIL